jgi:hypothetical protein
LFNDKFATNATGTTLNDQMIAIRAKLKPFFDKHVLTLKLKSADILDVFSSIHYLPVGQHRFLRLQNFINMIESTFVSIKHCIFLYDEQMVWSGINPVDLFSMNEYLVDTLFPKAVQARLASDGVATRKSMQFLTGPVIMGSMERMPKVYIYNSDEVQEYNLAVYRSRETTICLFIEGRLVFLNILKIKYLIIIEKSTSTKPVQSFLYLKPFFVSISPFFHISRKRHRQRN